MPSILMGLLTPCHIPSQKPNSDGYVTVRPPGSQVKSPLHRQVYSSVYGPVGRSLVIDHLCRNRSCANPIHLRAVTHRENILSGMAPTIVASRQNLCMKGHELSNDLVGTRGFRRCRTCNTERKRQSRAESRQQSQG